MIDSEAAEEDVAVRKVDISRKEKQDIFMMSNGMISRQIEAAGVWT